MMLSSDEEEVVLPKNFKSSLKSLPPALDSKALGRIKDYLDNPTVVKKKRGRKPKLERLRLQQEAQESGLAPTTKVIRKKKTILMKSPLVTNDLLEDRPGLPNVRFPGTL